LEINIQLKLIEPNPDKDENKPLSQQDAILGAERIAASSTFQKKNSILLLDHMTDPELREKSIDPKEILGDWTPDKIQTLLDRPIFDEAIYGTVQLHHRSVREYLTSQWLKRLLDMGKSRRAIEGLLFSNMYGRDVVIPSMRPIAAWLALKDDRIRQNLLSIAPEVLIGNGDPSTLPIESRKKLLITFTELYAERQHTGVSFDITMIRRLADTQLSSLITELLEKYKTHNDICILLLKIIWQGRITTCIDTALHFALTSHNDSYIQELAIRAVSATGSKEQQRFLIDQLLHNQKQHEPSIVCEIIEVFFPNILTVNELLVIVEQSNTPDKNSKTELQRLLEFMSFDTVHEGIKKELLHGFRQLIKTHPFNNHIHYCHVSEKYAWLLPIAIRLSNMFIEKKHPFSFDPVILDLFWCYLNARHYITYFYTEQYGIFETANKWVEFQYKLFWHSIDTARAFKSFNENQFFHITVNLEPIWTPNIKDIDSLFDSLIKKPMMEDRIIVLRLIYDIYGKNKKPKVLRERMKRAVAGVPELEENVRNFLHPKPQTEEQKKYHRQNQYYVRIRKEHEEKQNAIRLEWQKTIKNKASEIANIGVAKEGIVYKRSAYLYDRMREKKDDHSHYGLPSWQSLIDEFGFEVASNFRDGCKAYWRGYDPFCHLDNTIPYARIFGLSGLAMESADNPEWAKHITEHEAKFAAHYSIYELNGFPTWFKELYDEFPDIVQEVINNEIQREINQSTNTETFHRTLNSLRYCDIKIRKQFHDFLLELMSDKEPENDNIFESFISILMESIPNENNKITMTDLFCTRFNDTPIQMRKNLYLVAIFYLDAGRGVELLSSWIKTQSSVKNKKEIVERFCAALLPHWHQRFNCKINDYKRVEALTDLLPIIYKYVKVEEDIRHKEAYSSTTRDNAQQTRSTLLGLLANTPGRQSYDALLKLANSINFSSSKDYILFYAKERAANDAETTPWKENDITQFAESAEIIPRTEAELYKLALSRLDDLKIDIEEGDESEAALLRKAEKETELRIIFANRLKKSARDYYTVSSEEELADATRTDIRLHIPHVPAPVPIELKIANKWSLNELRERLENQLIKQYMRISKYGIFLLVHNGRKSYWIESKTNKHYKFNDLVTLLKKEVVDLISMYPNIDSIEIVGIDFTARFEKKTN